MPYLSCAAFERLEKAVGFTLPNAARSTIEEGLVRAVIDREGQVFRTRDEKRGEAYALFVDIERHSRDLERSLRKALETAHAPLWLLSLGAGKPIAQSSVCLSVIADFVELVGSGATKALKLARPSNQTRGAWKRTDRILLCNSIVDALRETAGWGRGGHDPRKINRFARELYPHIPASVATASKEAFVALLSKAFHDRPRKVPEK